VKRTIPQSLAMRPFLFVLALFALGAQPLLAQPKDAHIGYIFPAGGQRGTTFEVTIGGQFLDGTTGVLLSGGSGVHATVLKINKPFPQKRFNELRDYLDQARKKMLDATMQPAPTPTPQTNAQPLPLANPPPTPQTNAPPLPLANPPPAPQTNAPPFPLPNPPPAPQTNTQPLSLAGPPPIPQPNVPPAPRQAAPKPIVFGPEQVVSILKESGATDDEITAFLVMRKQRNDPKREQNQQLSDTVTLKMEIAADAQNGPCQIRLLKPAGVSNPLSFCVGDLPEQVIDNTRDKPPGPVTPTPLTLPVVVNGQIFPGAVDHFSFHAARGTHLVIAAQGRDLMPYLADAVPGWFQPALALYNEKGTAVAFADHFYFNPDPVVCYDVPEDGIYRLEVRDLLFRGREDFIYRITIGEVPFVTHIFPLGGPSGAPASLTVSGWNLPGTNIMFTAPGAEGVYPVPELSNGFATQKILFASDTLPQSMEAKPENTPGQAQSVSLPTVVNGRIDPPGHVAVFAISCRAGEPVVAEVVARRLNSPLDSWLRVTDATGRQLAFNDDYEDKGAGLLTQCADSHLTFTPPADGLYYVQLGDSQGKGGPEYAYRLRISPPMPDFALYVTPSGINGRAGASVPVTVQAVRKDGFSGDIFLAFKDASTGFVLDGGTIPAGQDKVRATVTFPPTTAGKPLLLAMEGHATIEGRAIIRPVQPVDDMTQAFMYHHLVPANDLIAVAPAQLSRPPVKVVSPGPMQLSTSGSAQAVLSIGGHPPFAIADTRLQLSDAPDGITVGDISPTADGAAISFKADAAKVKPGLKGNLIVEAFVEKTPPPVDGKPSEKKRWSIGFLPAIPFEVVDLK